MTDSDGDRPSPAPMAEYELTPEDWEEVNAVHLFDSPIQRQMMRRTRILSVLVFVSLALLCSLLGFGSGAILSLAAALITPILAGPMQQKAQRQALRKMAREGISHGTFGHHRVEIREEGLYHSTHAYETLFRWHAIDEVKEKSGSFLVYLGPNAFLPIPATAFSDSESLRRFGDAFYDRVAASRTVASPEAPREGLGSGDPEGPDPTLDRAMPSGEDSAS